MLHGAPIVVAKYYCGQPGALWVETAGKASSNSRQGVPRERGQKRRRRWGLKTVRRQSTTLEARQAEDGGVRAAACSPCSAPPSLVPTLTGLSISATLLFAGIGHALLFR